MVSTKTLRSKIKMCEYFKIDKNLHFNILTFKIKAAFESIKYFLQKKCSDPKHLNNDNIYLG